MTFENLSPIGGDRSFRSTCPQCTGTGGDRCRHMTYKPRSEPYGPVPDARGQVGTGSSRAPVPVPAALERGQVRDRGQNCLHGWVEPDSKGRLACCDCARPIYPDMEPHR